MKASRVYIDDERHLASVDDGEPCPSFEIASPLDNTYSTAHSETALRPVGAHTASSGANHAPSRAPKNDQLQRTRIEESGRILKSLETVSQGKNDKPEGRIEKFSAAGRDYFRVNLARGFGGRHQCMICTTANGHLLIWNAAASNERGLDLIVATLNSIAPLPQVSAAESAQSTQQKDGAEGAPPKPVAAQPERVRVSSGVTGSHLIKRIKPVYPADARAARIQGTVLLQAEISKTGDIADLELVDGPIELAGSAVAAVRQWKYKPYLMMGEPVVVDTQIQVNYQLRP